MQQELSAAIAGEIQKNNPFWEIFESAFTPLAPVEPVIPPGPGLEIYMPYAIVIAVALLVYLILRWRRKPESRRLPDIFFDEKEDYYYYQFPGEDAQWVRGDEAWLPRNYNFDPDKGRFFYNDGREPPYWIDPASLFNAANADNLSHIGMPIIVLLIGGAGAYFWSSHIISSHEKATREVQATDPYADFCLIESKDSLMPGMMTLAVLYDTPEGSEKPLAVARFKYLEGDAFVRPDGATRDLPALTPVIDAEMASQITGNSGAGIRIKDSWAGISASTCEPGRTIYKPWESDITYEVAIDRLKSLSLGPRTGSYEQALFASYDNRILINASSANILVNRFAYGDDFCAGDSTLLTLQAGEHSISSVAFLGVIVPKGTPPPATIAVDEYSLCGSYTQLEYAYD